MATRRPTIAFFAAFAMWAPTLRGFRFSVPPPTPDVPGEVAAISTAVGRLADGIASMVTAGPAGR